MEQNLEKSSFFKKYLSCIIYFVLHKVLHLILVCAKV